MLREEGYFRPIWLGIAVVTCVFAGATLNRCLTCGAPMGQPEPAPLAVMGERLDAPLEPAAPPLEIAKGAPPPAGSADGSAPAAEPQPRRLPPLTPPRADGEFRTVSFEQLGSFEYEFPPIGDGKPHKEQIPESIRGLAGRKIVIQGFMVPVKTEGEEVTEFLLIRYQFGCCYGVVPKMNEWIHVHMAPEHRAKFVIHIPVLVSGTFEVGEKIEDGIVTSIYRMVATEVSEPPVYR